MDVDVGTNVVVGYDYECDDNVYSDDEMRDNGNDEVIGVNSGDDDEERSINGDGNCGERDDGDDGDNEDQIDENIGDGERWDRRCDIQGRDRRRGVRSRGHGGRGVRSRGRGGRGVRSTGRGGRGRGMVIGRGRGTGSSRAPKESKIPWKHEGKHIYNSNCY